MISNMLNKVFNLDVINSIKYRSIIVNYNKTPIRIGKNVKFRNTRIQVCQDGVLEIGDNCTIENSYIYIGCSSKCVWGSNNRIYGMVCSVDGIAEFGDENIIKQGCNILIEKSSLSIKNRNRIVGTIWCRFGGVCKIGTYNTINHGTEIRCDESVEIGDYNRISMDCRIWDTNTHRLFYTVEEFNDYIISHFPNWNEEQKPATKPVSIRDSNWIGEGCLIKNARIGTHCILGSRAVVINKEIENDMSVTNRIELRLTKYC